MTNPKTDTTGPPRMRAPRLASVDAWLNTDRPLSLEALRGQVVLLDFWTYCCINCMHVLPDLAWLEEKYRGQPFVVIGVHCGKFDQEKDAANIRRAIRRHNIAHPVAVDNDYEVWRAYGVRAWPTLVVIDPEGYIVGGVSGEGHRDALDGVIGSLLEEHRAKGTLAKPMLFEQERPAAEPTRLAFPGKVLADAGGGRLFVSDTNHHRVLIADWEGRVEQVVGCGRPGLADGPADEARFRQPQGLALSADGQTLYVADTENHAVRAVDLKARTVTTVAGTGEQSRDYRVDGPGPSTPLSSPWGLACVGDRVYIANAGTHQLLVFDCVSGRVSVLAGTGREACTDGPNRGAAFAQPSGLACDRQRLFVADAEVSSIREVGLGSGGQTRTLAGSGGLFEFGNTDGAGRSARFQHPLGVALWHDQLFVADTFNDSIRRIDLASGQVTTLAFAEWGGPGHAALAEPGGVSVAGDKLFIADTNNHRIVAVDIKTRLARALRVTFPK